MNYDYMDWEQFLSGYTLLFAQMMNKAQINLPCIQNKIKVRNIM